MKKNVVQDNCHSHRTSAANLWEPSKWTKMHRHWNCSRSIHRQHHIWVSTKNFFLMLNMQPLSWWKTFFLDGGIILMTTMLLDQYEMDIDYRSRARKGISDGLSRRTKNISQSHGKTYTADHTLDILFLFAKATRLVASISQNNQAEQSETGSIHDVEIEKKLRRNIAIFIRSHPMTTEKNHYSLNELCRSRIKIPSSNTYGIKIHRPNLWRYSCTWREHRQSLKKFKDHIICAIQTDKSGCFQHIPTESDFPIELIFPILTWKLSQRPAWSVSSLVEDSFAWESCSDSSAILNQSCLRNCRLFEYQIHFRCSLIREKCA